jgi:hypothetical protein
MIQINLPARRGPYGAIGQLPDEIDIAILIGKKIGRKNFMHKFT